MERSLAITGAGTTEGNGIGHHEGGTALMAETPLCWRRNVNPLSVLHSRLPGEWPSCFSGQRVQLFIKVRVPNSKKATQTRGLVAKSAAFRFSPEAG